MQPVRQIGRQIPPVSGVLGLLSQEQTSGVLRCLGPRVAERWLEKYYGRDQLHAGPVRLPDHLEAWER